MDHQQNPSSSGVDRKTIERNRRNQMKILYSTLNSLVPHQSSSSSREATSVTDQLDEAANYIKKLQISLEKMKEKKNNLMGVIDIENNNSTTNTNTCVPAKIEINEMGSALQVVLITGLDFKFMFEETIKVIHKEGADIVNASFSVHQDTVFHTIHATVGESTTGATRAARIFESLNKFVDGSAVYDN